MTRGKIGKITPQTTTFKMSPKSISKSARFMWHIGIVILLYFCKVIKIGSFTDHDTITWNIIVILISKTHDFFCYVASNCSLLKY